VSVDLTLTDRLVELIDEGMDVVVRIGAPKDPGLVMRKLIDNHRIVVGAPDYLEAPGRAWPLLNWKITTVRIIAASAPAGVWWARWGGGRDPGRFPAAE
jgi:DNA-binding transcriptional LysR family regulator